MTRPELHVPHAPEASHAPHSHLSRGDAPELPLPVPRRPPPPARPRFLSEADCQDIARRLARFSVGGGSDEVFIRSRWVGNVRWARNRITTTGEDRDARINVMRMHDGAISGTISINEVSDAALVGAARRAERLMGMYPALVFSDLGSRQDSPFRWQNQAVTAPQLFFDATYQQDASHRAETARQLIQAAATAGMLSAGYLQLSAVSFAFLTSWGYTRYVQYTWAQASMTVRDPKGVSSGWAGVDWPDWTKIDGAKLAAIVLEKCLASRNPVAVEPGRYTTILEPQAVCDFVSEWGNDDPRQSAEDNGYDLFHKEGSPNLAKFGDRVIDERLTIRADPMDPALGFPVFLKRDESAESRKVFHPATWIERGVLKQLTYDRNYAITSLGKSTSLDASRAMHITVEGPTTSIPEMIATTERGLLVTRFSGVENIGGGQTRLCRGYTRDGLWLIEHGKISKAAKNLVFTEAILVALNKVEQVGEAQRNFHPEQGGVRWWDANPTPIFAPALKIKDFSFTALSDAI